MLEEETFGSESITSTIIFYQLLYSIDDLKNQQSFDEAAIDVQNLLNMKRVQAALTDSLANGTITIDDWMARDALGPDLKKEALPTEQNLLQEV